MTESAPERREAHLRAVEGVRARALALLDYDHALAVATDADTYRKIVLIGIARHHGSIVLAVDAAEYNWLDVSQMSGLLPQIQRQQGLTSAA